MLKSVIDRPHCVVGQDRVRHSDGIDPPWPHRFRRHRFCDKKGCVYCLRCRSQNRRDDCARRSVDEARQLHPAPHRLIEPDADIERCGVDLHPLTGTARDDLTEHALRLMALRLPGSSGSSGVTRLGELFHQPMKRGVRRQFHAVAELVDHSPVHVPFHGDLCARRLQFVFVQHLQQHAHVATIDPPVWRAPAVKTAVNQPGNAGSFVTATEFLKVLQAQWGSSGIKFGAFVAFSLSE